MFAKPSWIVYKNKGPENVVTANIEQVQTELKVIKQQLNNYHQIFDFRVTTLEIWTIKHVESHIMNQNIQKFWSKYLKKHKKETYLIQRAKNIIQAEKYEEIQYHEFLDLVLVKIVGTVIISDSNVNQNSHYTKTCRKLFL